MPPAVATRTNWAEDDEYEDPNALPPQEVIANADGTKTVVTYRFNDAGKKIKTSRRIRTSIIKEHVNPQVAERKSWAKFGAEKGHPAGPDVSTTSVGENIIFKPSTNWRARQKDDEGEESKFKDQLKDKTVACRICKGNHFTARCPFKDTLPPLDDAAGDSSGPAVESATDAAGPGGTYIAPHLRGKAGGGKGESMGGGSYKDRDDLATLRVTNVSEFAEEHDLRSMFERFGKVTRVFLATDKETGLAKGFAFISFADRVDAERACEKMDGYGFRHLILRVEFAKRSQ
ncbi:translation initiation factor eIF3 subunit g [Rhizina undulata]